MLFTFYRNNSIICVIPKSINVKNIVKKSIVVTTVIVYFVNSSRCGHLTLRISTITLRKNLIILRMTNLQKGNY